MLVLYNIGIWLYTLMIRVASGFNKKAKAWVEGRKGLFKQLEQLNLSKEKLIWVHAASLGEFEQGRPVIQALKKEYPQFKILLTFFSPSGYEIRKDYKRADFVFYLPADSKSNARRFIQHTNPKLAIFIKYDLWYHYLNQLQLADIPTILISATFRPSQFYFKFYGKWFLKVIRGLEHIFAQNDASKQLLENHGIRKISKAGDTRVDRVLELQHQAEPFPKIEQFLDGKKAMILGSTWPEDEELLASYINQNSKKWKYIIAPHDISEKHLKQIEQLFSIPSARYSKLNTVSSDTDLLIIDNIGMLSSIYQYGQLAYIGGGFRKGLHNTLEPIAFGLPVIFGPDYHKFDEAKWLAQNGGAFSIKSKEGLKHILSQLEDTSFYQKSSDKALEFIQQNTGATQKIMAFIAKLLNL